MADWKTFTFEIPGKDIIQGAADGLEAILIFLEVIKTILEVIRVFLIDFANPVRALVQALLALIEFLLESLKQAGLFAYFDYPDPIKDPNFTRVSGGFQAFITRFKGSLFDVKDMNRPQPVPGGDTSGFILFCLDAQNIGLLIILVKQIIAFFGGKFPNPQYSAPANARVLPVGTKAGSTATDPLLNVTSVFGATAVTGLAVEWSLPTSSSRNDGSFGGVISSTVNEFIPPSFLIEKTTKAGGEPVTFEVQTLFEDKKGRPVKRKEKVRDEYGDIFRKFEKYIVVSPTQSTASFLLGQLGTFRYVDTDVEPDKTYYYRVRAFSGSLNGDSLPGAFKDPVFVATKRQYEVKWPDGVTAGRPTGILSGRIPILPEDFDVMENLRRTFRSAYALGFHLPIVPITDPVTGVATAPTSDPSTGALTPVTLTGHGTLTEFAGALASTLTNPSPIPTAQANQQDPITGEYPSLPQFYRSVRFQSARVSNSLASAMMANSSALEGFRSLMQGNAPHSMVGAGYLSGTHTLEGLVFGLTHPNGADEDFDPTIYDPKIYETYSAAFADVGVRLNLVLAVNYLKSFASGGVVPDWISVNLLRDIIPWAGQFINELLDRIDALLAAFQSLLDDIIAFIDMIERKILILEDFIVYLISILELLASLQISASLLSVPGVSGGIPDWINAIDSAANAPTSGGPGSYTAGVALAYSAPDVGAIKAAFSLIFGG